jgi:hypothetical protein
MEVAVAEYRSGNAKENRVMKVSGLNKATDATRKRGLFGKLDLYSWLNEIRNGDQNACRDLVVQLQRPACRRAGTPVHAQGAASRSRRPWSGRSGKFGGQAAELEDVT